MSRTAVSRASWAVTAAAGVLVAMAVLTRLAGPGPRDAAAQIANPALDRQEIVNELRRVTDRLDRLIGLFESGKVKVVVANAEELKGPPAPGGAPAAERPHDDESKVIIRRKAE